MAKRRRARGEGSLYKRTSDGVWVGVLSLGRGKNGTRRRRFLYARTQRDLLVKLDAAKADMTAGRVIDPNRITVAAYLDAWVAGAKTSQGNPIRVTTRANYERFAKHINQRIGGEPLQRIQKDHVRQVFNSMEQDGIGAPTRRLAFNMLKKAIREAVRDDILPRSPMESLRAPSAPLKPRALLDAEQLAVLLEAARHEKEIGALVTVLACTGARLGEVLGLRWGDVRSGTIRIERNLVFVKGNAVVQEPKTNAGKRKVTLPAQAIAVLEHHRARLGALPHPDRALFAGPGGQPLPLRNFHRRWYKLLRSCSLPRVTTHSLRHLHASLLLSSGEPSPAVASRLGHKHAGITMETYAHALPTDDAALASKLEQILR